MSSILTAADVMMCQHGGSVKIVCSNIKAKCDGAFIVRPGDSFLVLGCPFTLPNGVVHPCLTVEWKAASTKIKVDSDVVLTLSSIGLCKAGDQAVQGAVLVQKTQVKVTAR